MRVAGSPPAGSTAGSGPAAGPGPSLLALALTAAAYAVVAKLGSMATTLPGGVSPIFPSAGIALAAVLLLGPRAAGAVWAGSVTANIVIYTHGLDDFLAKGIRGVLVAVAIAAGAALGAWLGAQVVRRSTGWVDPLSSSRGLLALVGLGAPVAGALSAAVGIATLTASGILPAGRAGYAWFTWWLGDSFGCVVAAPLVLAWAGGPLTLPRAARIVEAAALGALTLLVGVGVFFRGWPLEHAVMPLLIWSAFRFGLRGTTLTAAAASLLAVLGTAYGRGPFAGGPPNDSLLALDAFLAVTNFVGLLLAGVLAERRRLEAQVRQAQKMEAIATLAGGIAHDFNNILGVIVAGSSLVKDELPPGSPAREEVDGVLAAAQRARQLVARIHAFSRKGEGQPVPCDALPIVKETLAFLRAALPASVEIRDRLAPVGTVLIDPTQLHQLVMNLGVNAAQAMEERGGVLTITLEEVDAREGRGPGLAAATRREVLLTVADTGAGMTRDVMQRIFDPYFTTKAPDKGTGLGLSVVHGIATAAGGAIEVRSEPGRGSTFRVRLPVTPDPGAERSREPLAAP